MPNDRPRVVYVPYQDAHLSDRPEAPRTVDEAQDEVNEGARLRGRVALLPLKVPDESRRH
jgi:hypothetical protein